MSDVAGDVGGDAGARISSRTTVLLVLPGLRVGGLERNAGCTSVRAQTRRSFASEVLFERAVFGPGIALEAIRRTAVGAIDLISRRLVTPEREVRAADRTVELLYRHGGLIGVTMAWLDSMPSHQPGSFGRYWTTLMRFDSAPWPSVGWIRRAPLEKPP